MSIVVLYVCWCFLSLLVTAVVMQMGWSCSERCHLGYFVYMSFNEADFDNFGKVYNYRNRSAGYYKHNLTANAHPESKTWLTSLVRLYHNKGNTGYVVIDAYYFHVIVQLFHCEMEVMHIAGGELLLGPTVFRGNFCQIPRSSLQNSAAHCGKIVQILRLTAAFHLCVS